MPGHPAVRPTWVAGASCAKIEPLSGLRLSRRNQLQPIELARLIVDTAADKKAEDVLLLDVSKQSVVTDYFVICSGTSQRQLQAISEGILEQARKQLRAKPRDVEGDGSTGWLLLDFGDVIVHIFSPEKRQFYNLEELWRDAKVIVRLQ